MGGLEGSVRIPLNLPNPEAEKASGFFVGLTAARKPKPFGDDAYRPS
jgi:hypothetical protein